MLGGIAQFVVVLLALYGAGELLLRTLGAEAVAELDRTDRAHSEVERFRDGGAL